MKKTGSILCIFIILLILGTVFLQLAAIYDARPAKENSGISSLSGSFMFVERSFYSAFTNGINLRSVFFTFLYLAIFAVIIRMTYKQRCFIRRLTLQYIKTYLKTTNERESDA